MIVDRKNLEKDRLSNQRSAPKDYFEEILIQNNQALKDIYLAAKGQATSMDYKAFVGFGRKLTKMNEYDL